MRQRLSTISVSRSTAFSGAILVALIVAGCSDSLDSEAGIGDGEVTGPRSSSGPGMAGAADELGDAPSGGEPPSGAGGASVAPPQSGTLTAGAWDDNLNFSTFMAYKTKLASAQVPIALPFTPEEHKAASDVFSSTRRPHTKLDIALVIDTTGSMGDEIVYLQTEFIALSTAINARYPGAEQQWALVLYKDQSDEYLTRWFDFDGNTQQFRNKLAAQSAGGGGDFPEAADAALAAMNQLAWRSGEDVARLAFWVADAPHHNEKVNEFAKAVRAAQTQKIHIYPVASSGVDELTELSMRSTAQLTGGRYLFLTNDSGVGGSHKEPSIPCYFVTRLDDAIVRMVDAEMTGVPLGPAPEKLIRTQGSPQGDACTLQSGQVVRIF